MVAKLYYSVSDYSLRKVVYFLKINNIPHIQQNLNSDPLTWEQMSEILYSTELGVGELLARTNIYKKLINQGIIFEDLTLKEFHQLVVLYPRLIKTPILVVKNSTIIGCCDDKLAVLVSKQNRKLEISKLLQKENELNQKKKLKF